MIGGIRVASVHVRSGGDTKRGEGVLFFEMVIRDVPYACATRISTGYPWGDCSRSRDMRAQCCPSMGQVGRGRERGGGGLARGGEERKGEESLRLCRAIWRYSGKGYKFHREQIDKRLLYGSLRFFHSAHLVAAGTQSRDFYRRHRGPVYCLIVRVLPARDSPRRFKSIYKRGKVLIVRGHPSSNDLARAATRLVDRQLLPWLILIMDILDREIFIYTIIIKYFERNEEKYQFWNFSEIWNSNNDDPKFEWWIYLKIFEILCQVKTRWSLEFLVQWNGNLKKME